VPNQNRLLLAPVDGERAIGFARLRRRWMAAEPTIRRALLQGCRDCLHTLQLPAGQRRAQHLVKIARLRMVDRPNQKQCFPCVATGREQRHTAPNLPTPTTSGGCAHVLARPMFPKKRERPYLSREATGLALPLQQSAQGQQRIRAMLEAPRRTLVGPALLRAACVSVR